MESTHVTSSTIDCIGYQSNQLFIRFKSGGAYSYDEVPYHVFHVLRKAESVGSAFHRFVKGKYRYTRLGSDPFLEYEEGHASHHKNERKHSPDHAH